MTQYKVELIPIDEIFLDENFNCRGSIAPIDVLDLARDIKDRKLDTPITIQPYALETGKKYRIVAGHRRFTAFQVNSFDRDPVVAAKHMSIPCFVEAKLDETAARTQNLRENIHRKQLNILQEANAIKYYLGISFTENEVMEEIGVSKGWVQVRKALLALPKEIQEVAAAGILTQAQIKHCASLKSPGKQFEFVKQVKLKKENGETLSVTPSIKSAKNALKAQKREAAEIKEMKGLIYDTLGACLATRFGAWCEGLISSVELVNDLAAEAKREYKNFVIPGWVNKALVGDRSDD